MLNRRLKAQAEELGVTYEQLMEACQFVVDHDKAAAYPGTKTGDELEEAIENCETSDIWYEWKNEVGYEFDNHGSACCPEYDYPDEIFAVE